MTDFVFSNFDNLMINWINDGKDASNIYPSGEAIDLSHGEDRCCVWTWKVVDAIRAGLVFVQCRNCKANSQIIANSAGSLRMPCNVNIYPAIPS
jgi:hypothetical protein